MPWFTTRRSIGPNRRSVSATASAQPSGVPRSAATYSSPTADNSSALRDTTITRAPAADSSSAASRPIPRPPPVTSATRPFIFSHSQPPPKSVLQRLMSPEYNRADAHPLDHHRAPIPLLRSSSLPHPLHQSLHLI